MGGAGALWLLALAALLGSGVHAVQFEVNTKLSKCISEEIQNHVVVVGDYKIVHSDEALRVNVKVLSPYGKQLHYQENVQSGQFAFTTSETGEYLACFWLHNAPHTATLTVALDWKTGFAAKDWASIAKKDKLDGMELELRKLEDAVESIHSDMLHLREREAEMRNLNELTNSRVAWFGIMSLFVCLGVAGWQLWHLKTFFERKKLL
jgi:hypothetical protein